MATPASNTQLQVFSGLRPVEAGALALEELIRQAKHQCVDDASALTGLQPLMAEVKDKLERMLELTNAVEEIVAAATPAAQAAEPPKVATQVGSTLRGTTDFLDVPDLVSTLSSMHKTGTLTLRLEDEMFAFEFQDGKVVHAVTTKSDPDLRLGTILVAQNTLTEDQLQQNLDSSAAANALLGDHLVENATVTEGDLLNALDAQVRRIFESAFALQGAQFTFTEGSISNIAKRTAINTTEMLLEAAHNQKTKAPAAAGS